MAGYQFTPLILHRFIENRGPATQKAFLSSIYASPHNSASPDHSIQEGVLKKAELGLYFKKPIKLPPKSNTTKKTEDSFPRQKRHIDIRPL
ncbi:hypothetical protein CEXT_211221 [Caerostris extrusa]|uniref:Uncharacterized protein n=1 Tax=Caerostris extrusa TaxID=172846 RepID=A0AAV4NBK5_CAEEX|nr:hypothetical protein CEXT_211221 [Caerostris extrusa]